MEPALKVSFILLTIVICGLPAVLLSLRENEDPVPAVILGGMVGSSVCTYIMQL